MVTVDSKKVGGVLQWYVKDIGTLTRSAPVITPAIPITSQFYNKVVTVHEGRHATQWTTMAPWKNLFNATDLFNTVIKGMTATRRQDLVTEIQAKIAERVNNDRNIAAQTSIDRERDAFQESNKVNPDYLEFDVP